MANDIEDDWVTLGRPGRVKRTLRKTKEKTQGFLAWLGRAWGKLNFWDILWKILAILTVVGAVYIGVRYVKENGRIDYCRTADIDGGLAMMGHRFGRDDVVLIKNIKGEDILAWANIFKCELH